MMDKGDAGSQRLAGSEKTNYSYFSSTSIYQGLNVGQFKEYKDYGTHYGLVSEDPQWGMINLVSDIRKSGNKI